MFHPGFLISLHLRNRLTVKQTIFSAEQQMHLTYLLFLMHQINTSTLRIFKHQRHIDMLTREKIRKTDISKSAAKEKTEKADFRKLENRASEETENCIIKMTKRIRKQNTNKSVKNEFFIKRTEAADKEKLIIFSKNTSFFSILFFLKSRNSEEMKRITII